MKALIDTNVILDALLQRDPWADAAQNLLRIAAMEKFNAYITASQTTDIFYIICRQGVTETAAKDILKKLTGSVKVLDVTAGDVDNALASNMPDYEDALLSCCAKRQKAEYIITRNEKDFEHSPVPAIAPQAFLDLRSGVAKNDTKPQLSTAV